MHESTLELILNANLIVKLVLFILLGFSVLSWAIIFQKLYHFMTATRSSETFVTTYTNNTNLKDLAKVAATVPQSPLAKVFSAIYEQLHTRRPEELRHALKRAEARESEKLYAYLTFLATTGSTTPFIGLFGTVWGIMNAFRGIGLTGSASLAVVAPGIAEALVTTAAGLAAAIPAVVAYNYFLSQARRMTVEMADFSEELVDLLGKKSHET